MNKPEKNNGRAIKVPKSKFANYVRKLRIEPNSILAFSAGTITQEGIDGLAKAITEIGIPGVIILVVNDVHDIANLSEEDMGKIGWFKVGALKNLIRADDSPKEEEGKNEIEAGRSISGSESGE